MILDQADKELGCECLRRNTIDEKDHSAIAEEQLKNRMELNVRDLFGVKPFSALHCVVHIVGSRYGMFSVSRALPWCCRNFYINRFYRGRLLKLESIQRKG